jgi:hypothetical protein
MTHRQFLIRQAEAHWQAGQEVPATLLKSMLVMGINVDQEHRMFNLTNQGI